MTGRQAQRDERSVSTEARDRFLKRTHRELADDAGETLARRKSHKHLNKAINAYNRHDYGKAVTKALDAAEADPTCSKAYHLLGLSLDALGELSRALPMYEKALQLDPKDHDLYINLGLAAWKMKLLTQAEQLFRIFIELEPGNAAGWANLAGIMRDRMCFDEAIEIRRTAIYRMPEQSVLWNMIGSILAERGDFEQAGTFYHEALRLDPTFARVWHNLAYSLSHIGQNKDALDAFNKALELHANPADRLETMYARSHSLIAVGRLEEGFRDYEVRNDPQHKNATLLAVNAQHWEGQPLTGKSVIICGEQGLGDELMFANAIQDAIEAAGPDGHVKIAVDTRLISMFQRSFPGAEVGRYHNTPHNGKTLRSMPWTGKCDYIIPMASLLPHFRADISDFPRKPYLVPESARTARYREMVKGDSGNLIVGICWRSMLINAQRHKYYSALDLWEPILKTPGVTFVNLQYGDAQEDIARVETLFGVPIHQIQDLDLKQDLEGAAALSAACDIMIGAPTAAAAMAGAVGTETWFLVTADGWPQLGTDHYPWYAKSRAFKPAKVGDWPEMMPRVAAALAQRAVT